MNTGTYEAWEKALDVETKITFVASFVNGQQKMAAFYHLCVGTSTLKIFVMSL